MAPQSHRHSPRLDLSFLAILAGTMIILTLVSPFDRGWTLALGKLPHNWFIHFCDRSLFEGEGFGLTDLPILLCIACLLYILIRRKDSTSRTYIGSQFVLYSILLITATAIHSVKFFWGRARPYKVIEHGIDFTPWYLPGPYQWWQDQFSGSFPSGHTASFLTWIALAYCVRSQWLRRLCISLSLILCLVMGISRSVLLQHWVTDWLMSIGIGWTIIHYLATQEWYLQSRLTDTGRERLSVKRIWPYLIYTPLALILLRAAISLLI